VINSARCTDRLDATKNVSNWTTKLTQHNDKVQSQTLWKHSTQRGLCRRVLSVQPSITIVYCIETSKLQTSNFFHLLVALPFYPYHTKYFGKIMTGPYNGSSEYRWGIKNCDILPISLKLCKIGPHLLWNADRNSCVIYQMVPLPMSDI